MGKRGRRMRRRRGSISERAAAAARPTHFEVGVAYRRVGGALSLAVSRRHLLVVTGGAARVVVPERMGTYRPLRELESRDLAAAWGVELEAIDALFYRLSRGDIAAGVVGVLDLEDRNQPESRADPVSPDVAGAPSSLT